MKKRSKKVVIAAGGTGGHMFPAQALAAALKEGVLFAGLGLHKNRYFDRKRFSYIDIGNAQRSFKEIFIATLKSFTCLRRERAALVVGFGSYHSLPLLIAALFLRVPYLIFEPNAYPGRVNRVFSRWAKFSAVQFAEAGYHLKGEVVEVTMPLFFSSLRKKSSSAKEARVAFGLAPQKRTLLAFGGSQGAQVINQLLATAFPKGENWQVLHITGDERATEAVKESYERRNIPACVKAFETEMQMAWTAADLAVCRAGATTVAEQIAHSVPAIYIPFPKAAEDHQVKNAEFVEKNVQGAIVLKEMGLTEQILRKTLQELLEGQRLEKMRESIDCFKKKRQKKSLAGLIHKFIQER